MLMTRRRLCDQKGTVGSLMETTRLRNGSDATVPADVDRDYHSTGGPKIQILRKRSAP